MNKEKYLEIIKCLKDIVKGTKFENHLFSVGGCCRDFLCNREIKDIDLVIDLPNGGVEFAEWLYKNDYLTREPVTYPHFGTAMFHLKSIPDVELESVQTRKECYHDIESRNPETAFGTIYDDCTRRDFTYNAIYYNISKEKVEDFNGKSLEDLNNNILRTCGNPDIIFSEDPLRVLRAIRFTCRFNSTIEEKTFEGMLKYANRLSIISKERVLDEFCKMITSDNPELAVKLIFETGAYKYIFGSFLVKDEDKYLSQSIPDALKRLKNITDALHNNLEINLAVIYAHLPNMVERMKYLKFPNDTIENVRFYLDIFDMIHFTEFAPSDIRRIQYFSKESNILCRACDIFDAVMGESVDKERVKKIINMTKSMIDNGQAMFGYKLPINGNDVMEILNIGPSEKVKDYLKLLMDMAYINPFITKKECETILKCN